MCGIVGFIGEQPAAPILLEGLSKLEYRGYDSAGIAVRNEKTDKIAIVKAKGRLKILAEKTDNGKSVRGTCGIGHTRWATHGEPSENNAHPHCTDDKSVVLVHNGIIENYQELKTKCYDIPNVYYKRHAKFTKLVYGSIYRSVFIEEILENDKYDTVEKLLKLKPEQYVKFLEYIVDVIINRNKQLQDILQEENGHE